MDFKDRLRELREGKLLSPSKLASEFGKSESAIRMWETGRSKPDVDTLIKLAQYFGCSTDYLLGLSNSKNHEQVTNSNQWLQTLHEMLSQVYSGSSLDKYRLVKDMLHIIEAFRQIKLLLPTSDSFGSPSLDDYLLINMSLGNTLNKSVDYIATLINSDSNTSLKEFVEIGGSIAKHRRICTKKVDKLYKKTLNIVISLSLKRVSSNDKDIAIQIASTLLDYDSSLLDSDVTFTELEEYQKRLDSIIEGRLKEDADNATEE